MFLWRNNQNYSLIINKYPPYLWCFNKILYKIRSTYVKVHDPHTSCLKCFPWCYYTIIQQAIPMARSYQYQWLCKISSKSWARSCQYQCLRNSLSKYSTQFKREGHFHFFRIWRSAKPRPMINIILQFLELDLVNINVSAKVYQNFPNGLRVKFHCFRIWTSTNPKCGLTISWATSCQYQCVCKISSQYSISSRDRAIFTFSEFGARQSLDRWKMSFRNLLG